MNQSRIIGALPGDQDLRISIISPSFNQHRYIEDTLASVASQSYDDVEHIVVDGGSTDGSADALRAFEASNTHMRCIIEPDRGQADAINKGFRLATGEILAWINTDDKYAHSNVLENVAHFFRQNPDADVVYGRGMRLDASGNPIKEAFINRQIEGPASLRTMLGIFQPSVFFRRHVFEKVGGLSDDYNLQLDYEYWIRILKAGFSFKFMDEKLSCATVHEDAKSTRHRLQQLSECISMMEDHYDVVPPEWIERFASFYATRRDEKITKITMNEQEQSVSGIVRSAEQAYYAASDMDEKKETRIIITSFDSEYYQHGLNLIASLHRTSFFSFDEIHVYQLSLRPAQIEFLKCLEKVRVLDYTRQIPSDFPDFYEPRHRAYKVSAIASESCPPQHGTLVLWMDAGLAACRDIDEVFGKIARDDFFISDHDDSASWPLYNASFLHPNAANAVKPSVDELLGLQLCSCIIGYKSGGAFQRLIEEALQIGLRREAIVWPKVVSKSERQKINSGKESHAAAYKKIKSSPGKFSNIDDIYKVFPYYGHRTQSIYSILAHRYKAPISSARLYHKANDGSQKAAEANWVAGTQTVTNSASRDNLAGIRQETCLYHHRGLFHDLTGLYFKGCTEPIAIVGNGPSLRDFDFERLRERKWIGMNAAYRHWAQTGIYPTVYACLDEVVLKSHQNNIKKLIENRGNHGIEWFFLRKSFLEYWPAAEHIACVRFLEDMQFDDWMFDRGKITTGSFSAYICVSLGYSEIYLLGIDLNYVEKIPQSREDGRELIVKDEVVSNPNYFFDGYQQPGDRYNPPNRHPDMHLRSWNEVGEVLGDFPVSVHNCNENSAVRCFSFGSIDDAIDRPGDRRSEALRVADLTMRFVSRQNYWRRILLNRIGSADDEVFAPSEDQSIRFGRWLAQTIRPTTYSRFANGGHSDPEISGVAAQRGEFLGTAETPDATPSAPTPVKLTELARDAASIERSTDSSLQPSHATLSESSAKFGHGSVWKQLKRLLRT